MNAAKFRVYKCQECGNVGFDEVTDKGIDSYCSLCRTIITDRPGMLYVSSADEARRRAGILATLALPTTKVSMGRGLRRRVLDIVESLVDLNRLKPVTLEQVLTECTDAGIPRERGMHFLDILRDEGFITYDNGLVMSVNDS
ncbi:hypothetical protein E4H12_01725 [Candidatus Thorarchaeota archaeon]|nr:hypothetical protein [Candidatus Thorarchaeota archaeon]TFG99703.1 MAG: hypothetical protein E4H12_01725 [Candidatus Thorarchaeota archaeon]